MSEILERLEWHQRNTATGTDSVFFAAAQEIERLTAALATAEAERDAAVNGLRAADRVLARPEYYDELQAEAHNEVMKALQIADHGQPAAAPAVDAAPVGELTDAESARLTTPFLHTMMVCGEARDVFAGEFAAGIQQNVELENERALLSWRDRDLDSAMLHLINASARNAELIRRLQERKTR
jgi:hypothetical protein